MKNGPFLMCCGMFCSVVIMVPCRGEWLTLPGPHSHDFSTGQRVSLREPIAAPVAAQSPPLRTSGYTHFRSTLQFGQSADNYHRVQEWGDPVRPYGEWRFPYRPYSTPYPNWGAPFAGLQVGAGFGVGFPPPGVGFNGNAGFPPGFAGFPPGFAGPPPIGGNPPYPFAWPPGMQNPAAATNQNAPYPAGAGTPYPVAPYYDGYYPNYRE